MIYKTLVDFFETSVELKTGQMCEHRLQLLVLLLFLADRIKSHVDLNIAGSLSNYFITSFLTLTDGKTDRAKPTEIAACMLVKMVGRQH
jgi:hypothetical protein